MPESLTIARRASDALPAALRSEVRRLCDAAYEEATGPYFAAIGPGEHLLGFRGSVLVSHLMWVTRWLQPEGSVPLKTAYVELVATAPGEQRRGYATALLTALPPLLQDYELAALSPATEHLYARLGWRFWRGPLATRKGDEFVPTPDEEVMILPLPRTPMLNLDLPLSVEWRPGEIW